MKATKQVSLAHMLANFHPEATEQFYSLGYVCQYLQVTPGQVCVLLEATETKFVRVIDDVPYLDGSGFAEVVHKAREVIQEIEEFAASAELN